MAELSPAPKAANPSTAKPTVILVDSVEGISALVYSLITFPIRTNSVFLPEGPPALYIDVEGVNLGRRGSVSILQIYLLPADRTYIVDVHRLGERAFSTPSPCGTTLRQILEDYRTPKVFFDVRHDSDALYTRFGIQLRGVEDLQLMELAARPCDRVSIMGLARCIELHAPLTETERAAWLASKALGRKLFAPEQGGSYEVFNERPLRPEILTYCANDVYILPRLWRHYHKLMSVDWRVKMLSSSAERAEASLFPPCVKNWQVFVAPRGW